MQDFFWTFLQDFWRFRALAADFGALTPVVLYIIITKFASKLGRVPVSFGWLLLFLGHILATFGHF